MSIAATPKHVQQLSDLLAASFNLDELRLLTFNTFGHDLDQIAPVQGRTRPAITRDLTCWAAAQPGGLVRLAKAAAAERSNVISLRELAAAWADVDFGVRPCRRSWSAGQVATLLGLGLLLLAGAVVLYLGWPKRMPGSGFNVAVAKFGTLTSSGDVVPTEVTRDLSDWFFAGVENELAQLPPSLKHELLGPAAVGTIQGATLEERAQHAQQAAEYLNASILLYGVVIEEKGAILVQPEFYVNDKSVIAYAGELLGPNRLGSPVAAATPLDGPEKEELNSQLNARRQALEDIVRGLGYFFTDQLALAAAQFESAVNLPGWSDKDGKEIAYLLVAAAYLRQYEAGPNAESLAKAEKALQRALAINPGFARARIGLGNIALGRAVLYNADRSAPVGVEATQLASARSQYESAETAPDQSPASFVGIKADYGLAQVNSLGAEFHVPGYLTVKALVGYERVIAAAKKSDTPYLERLIPQSYAGLARVAGIEGDFATMAGRYQAANAAWADLPAAAVKRPEVARNWAGIGFAEGKQDHLCLALTAYRAAVTLGDKNLPGELKDWNSIVAELEALGACTNETS